MGYLAGWIEAEEHSERVRAKFPGCLGGTISSLRCGTPTHTMDCSRYRFERGFGIWCREPTDQGKCYRLRNHDEGHLGIDTLERATL
jgi:hypothetical protein